MNANNISCTFDGTSSTISEWTVSLCFTSSGYRGQRFNLEPSIRNTEVRSTSEVASFLFFQEPGGNISASLGVGVYKISTHKMLEMPENNSTTKCGGVLIGVRFFFFLSERLCGIVLNQYYTECLLKC